MLLTVGIIRNKIMSTFMNTIVLVLIGAVVYFCVLVLLNDQFFINNIQKILCKIRKCNGEK